MVEYYHIFNRIARAQAYKKPALLLGRKPRSLRRVLAVTTTAPIMETFTSTLYTRSAHYPSVTSPQAIGSKPVWVDKAVL